MLLVDFETNDQSVNKNILTRLFWTKQLSLE